MTDNSVGSGEGIGAPALNKALVFNAQFDFATDDGVDGTNIVQLLNVPAGIAPERVWVVPADLDWAADITLTASRAISKARR